MLRRVVCVHVVARAFVDLSPVLDERLAMLLARERRWIRSDRNKHTDKQESYSQCASLQLSSRLRSCSCSTLTERLDPIVNRRFVVTDDAAQDDDGGILHEYFAIGVVSIERI